MKDVVTIIGKIINKVDFIEAKLSTVDSLFAQYVTFNKDEKEFKKHLDKAMEELNANRENLRKSDGGNSKTKVANIKTAGKESSGKAKNTNVKDR